MRLSIVSPTYNEADNVEPFVREVEAALSGFDYEIVIVDDDSPDQTWKRAEELKRRFPQICSLRRTQTHGLSSAVIEGFTVARGEVLGCIDADLQHDPAIFPRMLQELDQGADLVIGSRYVEGGSTEAWSWHRWMSSRGATNLARILLHVSLKDPLSGFFLMRRTDFLSVRDLLDAKGFKILLEIVARLKTKRIVEVPYTFRKRSSGKSKLSTLVVLQYMQQLWKLSHHASFIE
jgi:dolichol-phosphate mannosyltransferase